MSKKGPTATRNDPDDWETDPDFERDMNEMDQRWGSKRTVGSINMNELIDQVRRDHKAMRDKLDHPSQRDHSEGFGGKFGVQHDRKDDSAQDYNYHEKLSKHTSQEIRKVITNSSGSLNSISDAKKSFMERSEDTVKGSKPKIEVRPKNLTRHFQTENFVPINKMSEETIRSSSGDTRVESTSPRFEESSTTRRIVREEKSISSSTLKSGTEMSPAFKSIQEKIDAFKKEFADIENKLNQKSDISKIIKKTTNIEHKQSNVEFVDRSGGHDSAIGHSNYMQPATSRPTSTSPTSASKFDLPRSSIKSLSEKFETLCRDDSENFRRQTEEKRKHFFDKIKTQVRETRRELDGFDSIDDDVDEVQSKDLKKKVSPSGGQYGSSSRLGPSSPLGSSRPSSRLSGDSIGKPRVYTHRETTQEEIVSKVVKENDKIIQDETKRNIEHSSSAHGSSEDEDEPTSIKYIDKKLRSSPSETHRTESPIDELKKRIPIIEPEVRGAGLMARTLYDYDAAESDELSFNVDDLITNVEKLNPGWYKGVITYKDGRKQEGLFPANYVKLLNDTDEY